MKHLTSLFGLGVFSFLLAACSVLPGQPTPSPESPTLIATTPTPSVREAFSFTVDSDDKNALAATQERFTVELKQYDFGAMVESINGQAADREHYWALYLNDEYAQAGASETAVQPGDTVTWKFEAIEQGL